MFLQPQKRKPPYEIILGPDIVVRFTFCTIEAEARIPRNEITMYLYSPKLKKRIGKLIQYRYYYSQAELDEIQKLRASNSETPLKIRTPSTDDIVTAVCKLFRENANLPLLHQKGVPGRERTTELNGENFAIFYLHHFTEIHQKYWPSEEERKEAQRYLVHMMIAFGNVDFSPITNKETSKQVFELLRNQISDVVGNGPCEKKSTELVRQCLGKEISKKKIRRTKRADGVITEQMKRYSNILWHVIESYLLEKKVAEYRSIYASYLAVFRRKSAPESTARQNLAQKTLSNSENKILVNTIRNAKISNDMKLALLMIFFMGLTTEEVCAINQEDVKQMEYYAKQYISVYKEYSIAHVKGEKKGKKDKNEEKYKLTDNLSKEQYRNIPIPDFIFSKLSLISPIENNDEPLLRTSQGERLCPKDITREANNILKLAWNKEVCLSSSTENGRDIRLDFKFSYCKTSLQYLWESFGLQDTEIRYLLGNNQVDTAGKHYIDFIHPHKQYSMFVQMNNALNAILETKVSAENPSSENPSSENPSSENLSAEKFSGELKNIYGNRRATLPSACDELCHTRIRITQPCTLTIKNKHGFSLQTKGELV